MSSSVSLRAAAVFWGIVAMLLPFCLLGVFWRCQLAIWVPRYHVTRVLDGTGLPALSLPPGEQDPLPTLLQETGLAVSPQLAPRSPWQLKQ